MDDGQSIKFTHRLKKQRCEINNRHSWSINKVHAQAEPGQTRRACQNGYWWSVNTAHALTEYY